MRNKRVLNSKENHRQRLEDEAKNLADLRKCEAFLDQLQRHTNPSFLIVHRGNYAAPVCLCSDIYEALVAVTKEKIYQLEGALGLLD